MEQRLKNTLGFVLLMALAAGIYLWYYPLDRGTVSVSVGLPDYWVFASEKTVECPADPCELVLKTGMHELKIRKDGYFPGSAQVAVKRFKTQPAAVELKKVPTLKLSAVVPERQGVSQSKPLPAELDPQSMVAPTWDAEGLKLAYLDKADEKVKVWSEGSSRLITPLKGIGEGFGFLWAPDGVLVAGTVGQDVYFIDTKVASRKKGRLPFIPRNQRWTLKGDALWMNDEAEKVFAMDPKAGSVSPVEIEVDLGHSVWGPDGSLIYYGVNEKENLTRVMSYNPLTKESTEIVSKYDFPVSEITRDANGTVYLYNPAQESWSTLEY